MTGASRTGAGSTAKAPWRALPRDRFSLAGAGAILLWSATVALARSLAEQVGPVAAASAVYLTGGALMLIHAGRSPQARRQLAGQPRLYLFGCGGLFAAYMLCLYLAVGLAADRTQVLAVGLVNYLWPALTLVLSIPLLGHRARWPLVPGTAAALAGVALAATSGRPAGWEGLIEALAGNPAAFLCGLGAAVTWALYSNLARRWSGDGSGVPLFMAGTGLALALLLWVLSAHGYREPGWASSSAWTGRALAELGALSVFTAVSYRAWDAAMRRGDVVFVVALSYFTPLLATVVAATYLGSWPALTLWVGCAFVVVGSLVSWQSVRGGDGDPHPGRRPPTSSASTTYNRSGSLPMSDAAPELIPVFENDGPAHYRIPSLAVTASGAAVAFCNRRVETVADGAEEQNLVARRSPDGGRTWEPVQELYSRPGWRGGIGTALCDTVTGEVMIAYGRGPGTEAARAEQERTGEPVGRFLARSNDEGRTWTHEPMEIAANQMGGTGGSHGSGPGITLRRGAWAGRLVLPARFATKPGEVPEDLIRHHYNCAVYSDDRGRTWQTSEPVQVGTGEGCLAERADGTLYFNSRAYFFDGRRRTAVSRDGGATWGEFAEDAGLTECNWGTNASLVCLPQSGADDGDAFVFANPPHWREGTDLNRDRQCLTARLSPDGGACWPASRIIDPGPSGYSSLAVTADGSILCLYEWGDEVYNDRGVRLARFDRAWLEAAETDA